MLGHVMAHEVGHLLLSLPGHTSKGIMIGPWEGKQLRQAAAGGLLFTPQEAWKMGEEVSRRMRQYLAAREAMPQTSRAQNRTPRIPTGWIVGIPDTAGNAVRGTVDVAWASPKVRQDRTSGARR
jgi:hypothetical protein